MSARSGSGRISPSELLAGLRRTDRELAVLDLREEGRFANGHILLASSLPLSRLEWDVARLVPRRTTRIVLCDDNDGLAQVVRNRLGPLGYSEIVQLDGGMPAWSTAGCEIFRGLNTPSKVLGVYAQEQLDVPEIGPEDLAELQASHATVRIIDCRPFQEYRRGCIPGAGHCPGVELVRQLTDFETTGNSQLVVNCAGRTRGLLGAQMLIDAGFSGKVAALRGGTMGWELSGRELERGAARTLNNRSANDGKSAGAAAETIRKRLAISVVDGETLDRWRSDRTRTIYLFDIRGRAAYEAGHIAGARHVAGGQLIQNLDQHVATQGARIVLSDDDGVRATATAHWLRRMGWRDVAIALANGSTGALEAGPEAPIRVRPPPDSDYVSAQELKGMLDSGTVLLVDLATSRSYKNGHIPEAWFAVRSRLARVLGLLPKAGTLVLTSDDGILAAFAGKDELAFAGAVRVLEGGTAAWQRAGNPLCASLDRLKDEPDDVALKPSELGEGREAAMREYLSGSEELLKKAARDGTLHLAALPVQQ